MARIKFSVFVLVCVALGVVLVGRASSSFSSLSQAQVQERLGWGHTLFQTNARLAQAYRLTALEQVASEGAVTTAASSPSAASAAAAKGAIDKALGSLPEALRAGVWVLAGNAKASVAVPPQGEPLVKQEGDLFSLERAAKAGLAGSYAAIDGKLFRVAAVAVRGGGFVGVGQLLDEATLAREAAELKIDLVLAVGGVTASSLPASARDALQKASDGPVSAGEAGEGYALTVPLEGIDGAKTILFARSNALDALGGLQKIGYALLAALLVFAGAMLFLLGGGAAKETKAVEAPVRPDRLRASPAQAASAAPVAEAAQFSRPEAPAPAPAPVVVATPPAPAEAPASPAPVSAPTPAPEPAPQAAAVIASPSPADLLASAAVAPTSPSAELAPSGGLTFEAPPDGSPADAFNPSSAEAAPLGGAFEEAVGALPSQPMPEPQAAQSPGLDPFAPPAEPPAFEEPPAAPPPSLADAEAAAAAELAALQAQAAAESEISALQAQAAAAAEVASLQAQPDAASAPPPEAAAKPFDPFADAPGFAPTPLPGPLGSGPAPSAPTPALFDESNEATVAAAVPRDLLRAASRVGHPTSAPIITPPTFEEPTSIPLPPPPQQEPNPEELHFHEVFELFVATKAKCNEPADGLTFDKFSAKLRKNKEQLVQKYACRSVRFQVYVKDGKAALKATPIKE